MAPLPPAEVRCLAAEIGLKEVQFDQITKVIAFINDNNVHFNVYYEKGTVGMTQLFKDKVTLRLLQDVIFGYVHKIPRNIRDGESQHYQPYKRARTSRSNIKEKGLEESDDALPLEYVRQIAHGYELREVNLNEPAHSVSFAASDGAHFTVWYKTGSVSKTQLFKGDDATLVSLKYIFQTPPLDVNKYAEEEEAPAKKKAEEKEVARARKKKGSKLDEKLLQQKESEAQQHLDELLAERVLLDNEIEEVEEIIERYKQMRQEKGMDADKKVFHQQEQKDRMANAKESREKRSGVEMGRIERQKREHTQISSSDYTTRCICGSIACDETMQIVKALNPERHAYFRLPDKPHDNESGEQQMTAEEQQKRIQQRQRMLMALPIAAMIRAKDSSTHNNVIASLHFHDEIYELCRLSNYQAQLVDSIPCELGVKLNGLGVEFTDADQYKDGTFVPLPSVKLSDIIAYGTRLTSSMTIEGWNVTGDVQR